MATNLDLCLHIFRCHFPHVPKVRPAECATFDGRHAHELTSTKLDFLRHSESNKYNVKRLKNLSASKMLRPFTCTLFIIRHVI